MTRISVMQGRLVPPTADRIQCFPRERWRDEFPRAKQAQLDAIEWIYDGFGADVNPIATDDGVEVVLDLSDRFGVRVASLCADYFMERPLLRVQQAEVDERLAVLDWLLGRCQRMGIERVVLPFVDASRIESITELQYVAATIERVSRRAEALDVEVHLETSLDPNQFADLLDRLPPLVKVNYDTGNSASLGYDPREEFAAYGSRVGSVHIKDRLEGGGTVPLGHGDADLPAVFECLHTVGYAGDFVMQVARGAPGDEVTWAMANRRFILTQLATATEGVA